MTNDIDNIFPEAVDLSDIAKSKIRFEFQEILVEQEDGSVISKMKIKDEYLRFQSSNIVCEKLDKEFRDDAYFSMSLAFERFLNDEVKKRFSTCYLHQRMQKLRDLMHKKRMKIRDQIIKEYPRFKHYTRSTEYSSEES